MLPVTGEKSEKLDTQKRVGYNSQERQVDLPTRPDDPHPQLYPGNSDEAGNDIIDTRVKGSTTHKIWPSVRMDAAET